MQKPTKISLITLLLLAISPSIYAQETEGYVNFNVGNSKLKHTCHQPVELYGCNTIITDPNTLRWKKANQVLSDVPYGKRLDPITNDSFFISKYYIASPPVFNKKNTSYKTLYDIGIVTPDAFILKGKQPVQMVYMDYNILQSMYIKYIDVKFDASFQHISDSMKNQLNVELVPFKVECADFPWIDKNGISDATGASGIGSLSWKSKRAPQLFLPYYFPTEDARDSLFLDCQVTILNDILFHYEVYFEINGKRFQSINLKDHKNDTITFHCVYLEELPCGCKEPEEAVEVQE